MIESNKILITGGSGFVGSSAPFGNKPGRSELDVRDPKSIAAALGLHKPTTVIHLAANVNMADCEENREEAHLTNAIGTYNIASSCKATGVKLVYLSTCALFTGDKLEGYTETDATNPPSVYGRTKLAGEYFVRDILQEEALIIRTSWLFGEGNGAEKRFVKLFYQKLKQGQEVTAVADRYGSPVYLPDLWNAIEKLIDTDARGIFNVVNSGIASYAEIAAAIKEYGNLPGTITPISFKDLPNQTIPRGTMEGLAQNPHATLRPWQEAMAEYTKKFLN